FVDALIVNWLIAGTDAHAKNYSFLLGATGRIRLAPLYDVTSALPYPNSLDPRKITFAMRMDGEYLVRRVGPMHWAALASALRLDVEALHERLIDFTASTPDAIARVRRAAVQDGLDHPIVAQLAAAISARSRELHRALRKQTKSRASDL